MTEKQYKRWKTAMHIGFKVCHCHQLPERSFFINGMQFPVCARCTGILVGFFTAPIICAFLKSNVYIAIGLIAIMALDGFMQLWRVWQSNNIRRLITGLGAGYGFFVIILHIICKIISFF